MIFKNRGKTYYFEWRSLLLHTIAFTSLVAGVYESDIHLTILGVLLMIYDALRFPYSIIREVVLLPKVDRWDDEADVDEDDDNVHPNT